MAKQTTHPVHQRRASHRDDTDRPLARTRPLRSILADPDKRAEILARATKFICDVEHIDSHREQPLSRADYEAIARAPLPTFHYYGGKSWAGCLISDAHQIPTAGHRVWVSVPADPWAEEIKCLEEIEQ